MRIGELSGRSGVAVPTIKYYLREHLLDPGTATAANQAEYGEEHLRRLKLIRALIDAGGVSVASARDVINALGQPDLGPHDLLGAAHHAVSPARRPGRDSDGWRAARQRAEQLLADRDWQVHRGSPAVDQLADVLSALASLEVTELLDGLDTYADSAEALAATEVAQVIERRDPVRMLELVVLGTVLGEALFAALRLLAHEHHSARALAASPPAV